MTKKNGDIEAEKKPIPAEPRFTRKQVLASTRYKNRKDLVSALLTEDRMYTIEEVDQAISRFMKGQVK